MVGNYYGVVRRTYTQGSILVLHSNIYSCQAIIAESQDVQGDSTAHALTCAHLFDACWCLLLRRLSEVSLCTQYHLHAFQYAPCLTISGWAIKTTCRGS